MYKPKSPRHRLLRLLLPLAFFILGCPPGPPPPEVFIPAVARVTVTVLGRIFYLAPGSEGTFLLRARDNQENRPLANARVRVMLNTPDGDSREVFHGTTDDSGLILVHFDVPEEVENPEQVLTVFAESDVGEAQYQEEVYVGRVYNVLVSTDKPVYQPGQVIHVRGLALDSMALKAAQGQPLVVTVADPQGNRLLRQEVTTSRWGVAALDFPLDSQAASGDYLIQAEMGPVTSSRSVEVKPYTLPRFKVDFQSDRPFYLPGEMASGRVDAHYFFGKPVANGAVRIEGFVTTVTKEKVFELSGQTDTDGRYAYEFQVPDYFIGQLEDNTAQVDLEVTVVDTANHAETVAESITVAEKNLLVEAVPESGFLRPGVENIVYLQASYPDGRSARAQLTVSMGDGEPLTVETDQYGLATLTVTPSGSRDVVLDIQAVDDQGQTARTSLNLGTTGAGNAVLLRPEKAEYRIGETLNVDAYVAGQATTVYLDIIKDRQTFGLVALPVENGVAQAGIDLDGSLLGTLELNAYAITDQGEIVRDRRLVLVNPAPAQVEVQADAEQYRPGDTAILTVNASRAGQPMPAALGISIVDESVFSVQAQDPGFARTYFLLERELLEPRYEIHDFAPLSGQSSPYDGKPDSIRTTASVESDARQVALFGLFGQDLAQDDVNASRQSAVEDATANASGADVEATGKAERQRAVFGPGMAMAESWMPRVFLALPLVGIGLYDGSRRRWKWMLATLFLSLGAFFWVSCAPAASPAAAPAEAPAAAGEPALVAPEAAMDETTATRGGLAAEPQPPRLRQFFPETLLWLPEVETDAQGRAQIQVPIADSITTWRVSVLASDQDGNLGSSEAGLRVFQDFFVEPDLPRFLTQGDELAVPVSLFNYLDEPQEVRLEVANTGWFEFVEAPQLTVQMGANEVGVTYIPIRVIEFGRHDLRITANGNHMSDAVLREVEVLPDGAPQTTVDNGRLQPEMTYELEIPEASIAGTGQVVLKLYPGIVSQMVDGLEGLLQQPYGCFEQTSSTTYPNVLVLDYLKATGQVHPRIQLQAEQYIHLGYQRLLTFETDVPGGFSLFGDPPPWPMLTAYGLMEFTDMGRVSYVDPALVERTADFLFSQQRADGSWGAEGFTVESGWERLQSTDALGPVSPLATPEAGQLPVGPELPVTAYMIWALADAGYGNSEPVQRGLQYVRDRLTPQLDPYAQAIVVNALLAVNPQDGDAHTLLDALLAQAQIDLQGPVYWRSNLSTYLGGSGDVASIETTAMVAMALMRAGYRPDVAQLALDFLISQRDSFGTFYTTQATILSLKALLMAARSGGEGGPATVTVSLNGGRTRTVEIDDSSAGVVEQVRFDDLAPGRHTLSITTSGQRALQYQVLTAYYLPWELVPPQPEAQQAMRVDVRYDRTELAVNDTVNVQAEVELLAQGQAGTVLVDLGLPPGFSPLAEDLEGLVERGAVERYELTGRQILLYLADVTSGQVYRFDYRLRARYPIRAQTPSSQAYDYYTPERRDVAPPQRIQVTLGVPGS